MHYQKKTADSASKQAVIYLRVSSEDQVENFSLDTQHEICQKEAKRRGYEIARVFREEGKSAKTITGRPELLNLLDFCRKNRSTVGALIIYRLDRLARNTEDYLAIRKKLTSYNIALISANEPTGNSPTEKLLETLLASFAQHDNDVRSERTKNGLRARFLAGLISGAAPLGYKNENGYAMKDPQTWDKVKKAWELMGSGTKALGEMAKIMNDWGLRQKFHGKELTIRPQAISRMFRNKFYIGIVTSEVYPEEIPGQHLPMVSEELFYRVQAILNGRNTNNLVPLVRHNRDNSDFPLRRIVKCGNCGTPLTGAWSKGKLARYGYYFCKKRCGVSSIPLCELENATIEYLNSISLTQDTLNAFTALLRSTYYQRVTQLKKRRDVAEGELSRLKTLRKALIEKNLSGVYSDEIFKEQNKIIEDQMASLQITKDDGAAEKYNLESIVKFVQIKFSNLGKAYEESSLGQARSLLCSIFPSGLVWNYPGYSNTEIMPIYKSIRSLGDASIFLGSA